MIRSLFDALFPKPRFNSGDRHHLLGGALEKYHMLVGRPGMKGRHDAIGGVERDFVEPLPFVAQMIGIETRLQDRKSVVEGKSVSVRVDFGGRRIIKKKKKPTNNHKPKRNTDNIQT